LTADHLQTGYADMLCCSCDLDLDIWTWPRYFNDVLAYQTELSWSRLSEVRVLQTDTQTGATENVTTRHS